jgi:hypothetical protein
MILALPVTGALEDKKKKLICKKTEHRIKSV